ncbi:DUF58 domain-containing protein [Pseudactinotalea sp. Z1748]|uniref:DUF58 domain-containing protein n=1 Tax=Pseudactinotalea sp. Z1748 TaxID=3413027 RepID=UPI003C7AB4E3
MVLTGRAVGLLALGLIPVLLLPNWLTVATWLVLAAALVGSDLALAAPVREVRIARAPIPTVRHTEETASQLRLHNTSARTLRALVRDAWQPSAGTGTNRHRLTLGADQVRRIRTPLRPWRRGDMSAAAVTVRSYGPFGLAARQRSTDVPGLLRVLPEFSARRHLPSRLARLREMDGRAAVNVRGQGTEFDSLREYVIGDDVRAIDWRASARRAEVVVRTWRPERDRRVLIVLDTSRLSAARLGEAPRLEAGIEATLLLAALAAKVGDRVDLVAMDRTVHTRVRGVEGPALMSALAQGLATLTPELVEPDWAVVAQEIRDRLSQRALVVILTGLEPGAIESGLVSVVAAVARDHQVVLASAEDPVAQRMRRSRESTAELFDAAAAERAELERGALAQRLQRTGAQVVRRAPEDLPPALADTYLALKAAGKL